MRSIGLQSFPQLIEQAAYIPGKNSVAFKKQSHYNTQFVWTSKPITYICKQWLCKQPNTRKHSWYKQWLCTWHKHTYTTSHNSHKLEIFSRACVLTGSRWGDLILEKSSWVPDLAQRLTTSMAVQQQGWLIQVEEGYVAQIWVEQRSMHLRSPDTCLSLLPPAAKSNAQPSRNVSKVSWKQWMCKKKKESLGNLHHLNWVTKVHQALGILWPRWNYLLLTKQ
jgi:hypothetical protein